MPAPVFWVMPPVFEVSLSVPPVASTRPLRMMSPSLRKVMLCPLVNKLALSPLTVVIAFAWSSVMLLLAVALSVSAVILVPAFWVIPPFIASRVTFVAVMSPVRVNPGRSVPISMSPPAFNVPSEPIR